MTKCGSECVGYKPPAIGTREAKQLCADGVSLTLQDTDGMIPNPGKEEGATAPAIPGLVTGSAAQSFERNLPSPDLTIQEAYESAPPLDQDQYNYEYAGDDGTEPMIIPGQPAHTSPLDFQPPIPHELFREQNLRNQKDAQNLLKRCPHRPSSATTYPNPPVAGSWKMGFFETGNDGPSAAGHCAPPLEEEMRARKMSLVAFAPSMVNNLLHSPTPLADHLGNPGHPDHALLVLLDARFRRHLHSGRPNAFECVLYNSDNRYHGLIRKIVLHAKEIAASGGVPWAMAVEMISADERWGWSEAGYCWYFLIEPGIELPRYSRPDEPGCSTPPKPLKKRGGRGKKKVARGETSTPVHRELEM